MPQPRPARWWHPGQLYARTLRYYERLQALEQRREQIAFRERRQDRDDIFSVHPRTFADLKRRGDGPG